MPLPDTNIATQKTPDDLNTGDYQKLEFRLKDLCSILDDKTNKSLDSRKLRYAEVDIDIERGAERIAPDELYIPQHIIDTNIRREQSSYVQYITESPRAVICKDKLDPAKDMTLLEQDLTNKLRFQGWQLSAYANIDAFQANGYGVMEVVSDENNDGEVSHEVVQYGDFAFICDTRNIQSVEMTGRSYYFTKTALYKLSDPTRYKDPTKCWSREQVEKLCDKAVSTSDQTSMGTSDSKDKSLYKVQKVMFRIGDIVHVAWSCYNTCDDWLRGPKPLFIGRRQLLPENTIQAAIRKVRKLPPPSQKQYETEYPYEIYPYLISEDDTIDNLKGRVYLDQDTQEAVSSLLSSTVTQARRAAGLYFSNDESDPNDDVLMQKNIFFRSGCLINKKVRSFVLAAPDPGMFTAIQALTTSKQQETSQVNFSVMNRKDARKTAAEMDMASEEDAALSGVQVVLYAISLTSMYNRMVEIIKSRVLAGIITVDPKVLPYYQSDFTVKPSGDVDVIERKKLIQQMLQFWPVVASTPAAFPYLCDLLQMMFPNNGFKYIQILQQAQQQAQSQGAQMQQQFMTGVTQMAQGIIELAKKPEMFSDTGRIHAYPVVQSTADKLQQMMKQFQGSQQQPAAQPQLTQ